MKLDKEFFNKRMQLSHNLAEIDSVIIDRIDFIVKKIHSLFNSKLSTWYFPGAEEGSIGNFDNAINYDYEINDDYISIVAEHRATQPIKLILNDGKEIEAYSVPIRWLFEDFEEELIKGKQLYLEKIKKQRLNLN